MTVVQYVNEVLARLVVKGTVTGLLLFPQPDVGFVGKCVMQGIQGKLLCPLQHGLVCAVFLYLLLWQAFWPKGPHIYIFMEVILIVTSKIIFILSTWLALRNAYMLKVDLQQ